MARKLVLHAGDPAHRPPDARVLAATLADIGLIADTLPGLAAAWYAGDAFLSQVIFLGCSPRVEFVPADDRQEAEGLYCHVRYRVQEAESVFRAAPGRLQPRCPVCRAAASEWRQQLHSDPPQAASPYHCTSCERTLSAAELDWRQNAGFGRWFLEIWNVHPHEAVPAEALITALERIAGTPVRYFYE
jgi:hypothetical protein